LLTVPLYLLLPRRIAIAWGRYAIMVGFRLYRHWLGLLRVYRLDVSALDALRDGPPLILAPNHRSLIDAPLMLARHPNLTCVMKSELTDNLLFGPGARLARYIRNRCALQMVREAVATLKDGATRLLFPEGARTTCPPLNDLKEYRRHRQACAGASAHAHHRYRLAVAAQGLALRHAADAADELPGAARARLLSVAGRGCLRG
jgi:1-acyl-sn-glycerol-3-phosphate acyltransferase